MLCWIHSIWQPISYRIKAAAQLKKAFPFRCSQSAGGRAAGGTPRVCCITKWKRSTELRTLVLSVCSWQDSLRSPRGKQVKKSRTHEEGTIPDPNQSPELSSNLDSSAARLQCQSTGQYSDEPTLAGGWCIFHRDGGGLPCVGLCLHVRLSERITALPRPPVIRQSGLHLALFSPFLVLIRETGRNCSFHNNLIRHPAKGILPFRYRLELS